MNWLFKHTRLCYPKNRAIEHDQDRITLSIRSYELSIDTVVKLA
jgi:hypothetical protein